MATKTRTPKSVPFSRVKTELSSLLSEAEDTGVPVVILRHGKPAGAIIGFADEDDYFDWRMENDPGFREGLEKRLLQSAAEAKAGKLISLKELKKELRL